MVATSGRGGVRGNDLEDLAGGVRPAVPDRIAIPAARVDTVVDAVGTGPRRRHPRAQPGPRGLVRRRAAARASPDAP